jgi:sugar lactone lactonase YvrE
MKNRNISIFQYFNISIVVKISCCFWLRFARQYCDSVELIRSLQFHCFQLGFDTPVQKITSCSVGKMKGLAVLLWALLVCNACATITTLASSSNAIASHNKNAKYQESSPSSGILSTVAGYKTLEGGSDADGIPATSKQLYDPKGLAVDKEGNVFIVDSITYKNRPGIGYKIWKVTASSGIITTVAGTDTFGYSGDGGQATSATLKGPYAVALDTSGNIYIADSGNNRIRKVTVSTGVISTVAGDGNERYVTDNVAATSTSLSYPKDVAVDASGNIFIADTGNGRIRKVTASTGIITTIAGSSKDTDGYQGGIATEYYLERPTGVALDSTGNVYIAGGLLKYNVFKVTVSTGIISIVAGIDRQALGALGYNGDNILATKADLYSPMQVAFDASDNMFINDADNNRIRRVSASTGIITTVAGTDELSNFRSPNDGDGGSAILVSINRPSGLAVAANGDFYFSLDWLNVVKKVTYTTGTPSSFVTAAPAVTPAVTPSTPSTATAPTPSASSPSSPSSPSISKAPSTSSTTGSQSSATTHVAQTLHVTMILLSSLLILHLC